MDTVGDQPVEAIEARQDNGVPLADFLLSEIHSCLGYDETSVN